MGEKPPFDPSDPYDIMTEHFRVTVSKTLRDAEKITIWRDMPASEQMAAFAGGVMVGLIGSLFAINKPEARDAIYGVIVDSLPQVREQAAELVAALPSGEKPLSNPGET